MEDEVMTTIKDVLHEVMPVIEKSAPAIGRIIGGPVGLATTFAVSLLAHAFGTHPSDIQNLPTTILNDPTADIKLRELEKYNADLLATLKHDDKPPTNVEININMK